MAEDNANSGARGNRSKARALAEEPSARELTAQIMSFEALTPPLADITKFQTTPSPQVTYFQLPFIPQIKECPGEASCCPSIVHYHFGRMLEARNTGDFSQLVLCPGRPHGSSKRRAVRTTFPYIGELIGLLSMEDKDGLLIVAPSDARSVLPIDIIRVKPGAEALPPGEGAAQDDEEVEEDELQAIVELSSVTMNEYPTDRSMTGPAEIELSAELLADPVKAWLRFSNTLTMGLTTRHGLVRRAFTLIALDAERERFETDDITASTSPSVVTVDKQLLADATLHRRADGVRDVTKRSRGRGR